MYFVFSSLLVLPQCIVSSILSLIGQVLYRVIQVAFSFSLWGRTEEVVWRSQFKLVPHNFSFFVHNLLESWKMAYALRTSSRRTLLSKTQQYDLMPLEQTFEVQCQRKWYRPGDPGGKAVLRCWTEVSHGFTMSFPVKKRPSRTCCHGALGPCWNSCSQSRALERGFPGNQKSSLWWCCESFQ